MKLNISIQGQGARTEGQKLLDKTHLQGQINTPEGVKSIFDAAALVEIANALQASAEAVKEMAAAGTAVVALAKMIWEWRQQMKKEVQVVIEKEDDDGNERLLLEQETLVEQIEAFLSGED